MKRIRASLRFAFLCNRPFASPFFIGVLIFFLFLTEWRRWGPACRDRAQWTRVLLRAAGPEFSARNLRQQLSHPQRGRTPVPGRRAALRLWGARFPAVCGIYPSGRILLSLRSPYEWDFSYRTSKNLTKNVFLSMNIAWNSVEEQSITVNVWKFWHLLVICCLSFFLLPCTRRGVCQSCPPVQKRIAWHTPMQVPPSVGTPSQFPLLQRQARGSKTQTGATTAPRPPSRVRPASAGVRRVGLCQSMDHRVSTLRPGTSGVISTITEQWIIGKYT